MLIFLAYNPNENIINIILYSLESVSGGADVSDCWDAALCVGLGTLGRVHSNIVNGRAKDLSCKKRKHYLKKKIKQLKK